MPKRSAAAPARDFLRRGPHLARDRAGRNKHNGKGKKGNAKGKKGYGNGKGFGEVSIATAFTIASRPKSVFFIDHGSDHGVEYSDEKYNPFDVYASSENHVFLKLESLATCFDRRS